jgi:hypothetical protein
MNLWGTAIAAFFLCGTRSGFAAQVERGTESAECKGIVARLLAATDETFDHYSPSGENVFFRNRKGVLSCTSYRHASISFTWDTGGFPPDQWFGLLAKAGKAVTGADLDRLISASRECYRSAKDKTELADIEIPNAKIECQAFAFDNGKMNISIRISDGVLPVVDER